MLDCVDSRTIGAPLVVDSSQYADDDDTAAVCSLVGVSSERDKLFSDVVCRGDEGDAEEADNDDDDDDSDDDGDGASGDSDLCPAPDDGKCTNFMKNCAVRLRTKFEARDVHLTD